MNLQESIKTSVKCLLDQVKLNQEPPKIAARVYMVGMKDWSFLYKRLQSQVPEWQLNSCKNSGAATILLAAKDGPVWILRPSQYDLDGRIAGHDNLLRHSPFGLARDLAGLWLRQNASLNLDNVLIEFHRMKDEEIEGALTGLGLAAYRFLDVARNKGSVAPKIYCRRDRGAISKDSFVRAAAMARGMNIARHLANLPGNEINPVTMAKAAKDILGKAKNVRVEVWDEARLKKEKMGLLIGVGAGSATGARLIHISYRPRAAGKAGNSGKAGKGVQPVAFVGKGITFDTGGLDIKGSSSMRLMKKDMAGAATLFGLAAFVSEAGLSTPCDFYLAMAENAISENSTRPGDIHISRSGKAVEIHNTDAEGRLALADALDVAVTREGRDEPAEVIDVATLTGAMRVAVGLDVAGFFANDDRLAKKLQAAAAEVGEFAWRMPLVQKYRKYYSSNFADFANASDSSFGGAITAALFLENFVRGKSWAHFDVMSWNMSGDGALSDGANAQTFQILARYLEKR